MDDMTADLRILELIAALPSNVLPGPGWVEWASVEYQAHPAPSSAPHSNVEPRM